VFENKVRRKVLESKKNEVTRNWRRLHDEESPLACAHHYILLGPPN